MGFFSVQSCPTFTLVNEGRCLFVQVFSSNSVTLKYLLNALSASSFLVFGKVDNPLEFTISCRRRAAICDTPLFIGLI